MRNKLYIVMCTDSEGEEWPYEFFLSRKQAERYIPLIEEENKRYFGADGSIGVLTFHVRPEELHTNADVAIEKLRTQRNEIRNRHV